MTDDGLSDLPVSPRAVLADDEPLLREALAAALARAWPELQIAAACGDGQSALEAIRRERPDVAFLDIHMPGLNGLQVAQQAAAAPDAPMWVFVTAHDEYALEAFDREAIDYLLKPIDSVRLERTVARLRSRIAPKTGTLGSSTALDGPRNKEPDRRPGGVDTTRHDAEGDATSSANPFTPEVLRRLASLLAPTPASQPLRWLRASMRDEVRLIPIEEVVVFEAADKYLRVLTRDLEALVRMPLKDLLERLPPDEFWQIHRGTVVRARDIDRTTRGLSGKLVVHLRSRPERFEVSRPFAHLFRAD
jgi:DNA-binding LytR/AlgR family response regulator